MAVGFLDGGEMGVGGHGVQLFGHRATAPIQSLCAASRGRIRRSGRRKIGRRVSNPRCGIRPISKREIESGPESAHKKATS